jgi:hypothetical protein
MQVVALVGGVSNQGAANDKPLCNLAGYLRGTRQSFGSFSRSKWKIQTSNKSLNGSGRIGPNSERVDFTRLWNTQRLSRKTNHE